MKDNSYVHVTMVPNPSHLEAVNPVALGTVTDQWLISIPLMLHPTGKARARMLSSRTGPYSDGGDQPNKVYLD